MFAHSRFFLLRGYDEQGNSHTNGRPSSMTGTPFPTDGTTRAAAFFDLDKTIIATSSAYAFGREFMHNGLITHAEALQLSLAKASYMLAGHSSEHMDTTRDQLAAMAAGWSVQEVHDIAVAVSYTHLTLPTKRIV